MENLPDEYMRNPTFKNLYCDGPLCCPWKHGKFNADSISVSCGALKIIEGEDITKYGWEYRQIDGDMMVLCPDCQKEIRK